MFGFERAGTSLSSATDAGRVIALARMLAPARTRRFRYDSTVSLALSPVRLDSLRFTITYATVSDRETMPKTSVLTTNNSVLNEHSGKTVRETMKDVRETITETVRTGVA